MDEISKLILLFQDGMRQLLITHAIWILEDLVQVSKQGNNSRLKCYTGCQKIAKTCSSDNHTKPCTQLTHVSCLNQIKNAMVLILSSFVRSFRRQQITLSSRWQKRCHQRFTIPFLARGAQRGRWRFVSPSPITILDRDLSAKATNAFFHQCMRIPRKGCAWLQMAQHLKEEPGAH